MDIYVRDRFTGITHRVGTDENDRLFVDGSGIVQYENIQNGCRTMAGEEGEDKAGYEFVGLDQKIDSNEAVAEIIQFSPKNRSRKDIAPATV